MQKVNWFIIAVITAVISVAAITDGSMWGDEICRVTDPVSGNFWNTWNTAVGYGQPGYMTFVFFWVRLVGRTEFLMRTSNLLFAGVAFCYVYKIMRVKKCNPFFALLFFIHPVFVYYMDEVTPYIAVYALSIAFIWYVFYAEEFDSTKNIIMINAVFLLGVFIHFIFGFIYVLYIVKLLSRKPVRIGKHGWIFLAFCVLYIPLLVLDCYGLYYGTSTRTGFGIENILYIAYAFLGFVGLGISRNDLRSRNFAAMDIRQVVGVSILFIVVMSILAIWFINRKKAEIDRKEMVVAAVIYFIIFTLFSLPIGFGLWERHCVGILPVFLLVMVDVFQFLLCGKGRRRKTLVIMYIFCIIISAAGVRFDYYYACDDYKGVSGYLKNKLAENEEITILTYFQYGNSFDKGKYYDISNTGTKTSQKIINLGLTDEETFKQAIEEHYDKGITIVVLFEKAVSSELYHAYDNRDDVRLCDTYNSFKIVEY